LLKLADFLETVPRKKFDMRSWQRSAADKPEGRRPGECGFAGCAVGWAVHQRMFRGLKFIPDWSWGGDLIPHYNGQTEWRAITDLFLIGYDEAFGLFGPQTGGTPKQVAKRIRKFVKDLSSDAVAAP
jgi:hypothetical protein